MACFGLLSTSQILPAFHVEKVSTTVFAWAESKFSAEEAVSSFLLQEKANVQSAATANILIDFICNNIFSCLILSLL
jgi:hypothetical protein